MKLQTEKSLGRVTIRNYRLVCDIFLMKLRLPKNKNLYDSMLSFLWDTGLSSFLKTQSFSEEIERASSLVSRNCLAGCAVWCYSF